MIDSDPIHAFMLGKNLYCYLKGGLVAAIDAKEFRFTEPIYQTFLGKQFKSLISELVKPVAEQRISVSNALKKLEIIHLLSTIPPSRKLENIITNLNTLKSNNNPNAINDIIKQNLELIKAKPEDKDAIIKRLETLVSTLNTEKNLPEKLRLLSIAKNDPEMDEYIQQELSALKEMPILEKEKYLATFLNNSKEYPDATRLFTSLSSLTIAKNDTLMRQFIAQKEAEFLKMSIPERPAMLRQLQSTLKALNQEQEKITTLTTIIQEFRSQAGLFTIGYREKANRIEKALLAVPVEERMNLLKSPKFKAVEKALASHRLFGSKEPSTTKNGQIDIKTAAQSFKTFKDKFSNAMTNEKPINDSTHQPKKP